MMKLAALSILAALVAAEATTKIAVLEFGRGGTVRRSEASNAETSTEGVLSFWSALHGRTSSNIQHAGMTVVPDLFRKPDSGVIVGISGTEIDLHSFNGFSSLFDTDETVGFFEVAGNRCASLLDTLTEVIEIPGEDLKKATLEHVKKNGLYGIKVNVASEGVNTLDKQIIALVSELKTEAQNSDETFIIHFVIEENESQSRRRLSSRELEDEQNQNANGENVEDDKEYNGYYGYAYVNKYGVWVTPYKTMFQIQYFNVVTWTAIGLALVLIFGFFLMVQMPLEPDTLLFGESAKFVGDD
jgi:hypothetical protein